MQISYCHSTKWRGSIIEEEIWGVKTRSHILEGIPVDVMEVFNEALAKGCTEDEAFHRVLVAVDEEI